MRLPGLLRFKSNERRFAPCEEENSTAPRLRRNRFALRSNPVSIFEQMKTETIRYHTLLQTALTYLKELASFDPDYCLGPPRCVYPRACQVGTSLSQQYPFFVHVR